LRSIKEAALDLVVEDGVDQFSVHRVAERVDLTTGALYRYFDSRDDILVAVQLEVLEGFDRYLDAVVSKLADAPPVARIVHLLGAYAALERLQPERFRLIVQLVAAPEPLFENAVVEPAIAKAFAILGKLADAFEDAARQGALDAGEARRRALIAWSSTQALADRKKMFRFGANQVDFATLPAELLRALLVGWGARVDDVQAALEAPIEDEILKEALDH
jgi:AcrR family transcriptional regulator